MSNLTQKQQLQNTVDELLRVEKARGVSEVFGIIAALAVGIGFGIAGLPILSIASMAFASG
ncbi:hypothetical protein IHO40_01755 [Wolbachia endosymbiont of Mansonella ozzardi]|uniref:hypothetical protein n=1 Tax=Wolbachia endosymbiont of Mansonella ozzardi TaxID=137464 RepID=UPI001CE179D6|nr:hypothetical protein [Wolbachia endosymbiont of Mansonella ozzardi]MCA4774880.1 hypothetical protein [Wolbachia endosymbiont of Mansonella ozzardi]